MTFYTEIGTARPVPVFVIGAGGIVNTAHLPAYRAAGFDVQGIFDIDRDKAATTAEKFAIPFVFNDLEEMAGKRPPAVVFDVAVPGSEILPVLEQLPAGAAVLIQKPMGEDLAAARKILELTRQKEMIAGMNFQLRYAPAVMAVRDMIAGGELGELYDIEININVYTPWQLWDFLYTSPRVEILYHSIHYIDLVRSFLGNPEGVYAKTTQHPAMKELASVRSTIIMDYGPMIRANILTNHCHPYGPGCEQASVKFEGSRGAAKIGLGVLKNYPAGEPDTFEYTVMQNGNYTGWKQKEMAGNWFPDAFAGSMMQVMLAAQGAIDRPDNSVEDCIHTMACVEAAYRSDAAGGIRPDSL
ncbi:MAG: Gfo/Idh/MocA family oxidoreductase [Chitinophagaceae bacterium]